MNQLALVQPGDNALPAYMKDVGAVGNENITADTLATPRLYLLQSLSPQQQRGNADYVEGAAAGMYINSITNELYNDLFVSNLFMNRGYNVNKKRTLGGNDWRGFHATTEAALERLARDGVNPADYDIVETHTHTLVMLDPMTGHAVTPLQFSLKATATRESRSWNSAIVTAGADRPRFTSVWRLGTKLVSNAKGSWYAMQPAFAGWAPEPMFQELHDMFVSLRGNADVAQAGAEVY